MVVGIYTLCIAIRLQLNIWLETEIIRAILDLLTQLINSPLFLTSQSFSFLGLLSTCFP